MVESLGIDKPKKFLRWDRRFMDLAFHIAQWSKDPNTKVGAVIVFPENHQIIATGYNGIPRHVEDLAERMSRENGEKYKWMEHAERNAIYQAAAIGVPIAGCALYTTLPPCGDCVRAIIQSGIWYVHTSPSDVSDAMKATVEFGKELCDEAGVSYETISV